MLGRMLVMRREVGNRWDFFGCGGNAEACFF